MDQETYINHPNFGLLYRLCQLEDSQELYTTLYAQRLFFVVKHSSAGLVFDPVTRADAKLAVESYMRYLRRRGEHQTHQKVMKVHKRTFQ